MRTVVLIREKSWRCRPFPSIICVDILWVAPGSSPRIAGVVGNKGRRRDLNPKRRALPSRDGTRNRSASHLPFASSPPSRGTGHKITFRALAFRRHVQRREPAQFPNGEMSLERQRFPGIRVSFETAHRASSEKRDNATARRDTSTGRKLACCLGWVVRIVPRLHQILRSGTGPGKSRQSAELAWCAVSA